MQASSPLGSPFGWLDRSDFYINKDTRLRPTARGLASLRDTSVNRTLTEWAIFRRNVFDTCNHYRLTDTQLEAWALLQEAARQGIHPRKITRYIADKRHTSLRAAQRLVKRLDIKLENSNEANMFVFEAKPDVISKDSYLKIADKDIEIAIASIEVLCAGHGTPHCAEYVTAKYGICFSCRQKYGLTVEDRRAGGYEWVNEIMSHTKAEARTQARDKLYLERYGMIPFEDLE